MVPPNKTRKDTLMSTRHQAHHPASVVCHPEQEIIASDIAKMFGHGLEPSIIDLSHGLGTTKPPCYCVATYDYYTSSPCTVKVAHDARKKV